MRIGALRQDFAILADALGADPKIGQRSPRAHTPYRDSSRRRLLPWLPFPLEAAAAAMREAMRETVKRYSLWYLLQGILMVAAGVLALIYPVIASVGLSFCLPGS